jgi:photosystem II stability/assembly factor-like uncharacterized protein
MPFLWFVSLGKQRNEQKVKFCANTSIKAQRRANAPITTPHTACTRNFPNFINATENGRTRHSQGTLCKMLTDMIAEKEINSLIKKNMKFHYLLLFYFILVFKVLQADGWEWQNPTPQGNWIYSSYFFSTDLGFAVGDNGTIIKTDDGGENWTRVTSSSIEQFFSIHFPTLNIGYIVGGGATVLKTTDGGDTWESLVCSQPQDIFKSTYFISSDTGFITSAYGKIFKTTDGGTSWSQISLSIHSLLEVEFTDANNGIVVGDYGKIFKTIDCGESWTLISSGVDNTLFSCCYVDSTTIIVVGSLNAVLKSINGGNSWNAIQNIEGSFHSVDFNSSGVGFIVSLSGEAYKSIDKGASWQPVDYDFNHDLFFVNAVSEASYVFGVTRYPGIYKSNDNGNTWAELSDSKTHYPMLSLDFYDEFFGYAASYGHILKTTNGGENWTVINEDPLNWYTSIFAQNQLVAYSTGLSGYFLNGILYTASSIKKTIDGGITWDSLPIQASDFCNSICFKNENIGFAVGTNDQSGPGYGDGLILKTTDGGLTWSREIVVETSVFNCVECTKNNIYIVGDDFLNAIILKSDDEGNTWQSYTVPNTTLMGVSFPNDSIGYAAGNNKILKTTNSGASWEELEEIENAYHQSISFINLNVGYVTGKYGRIFRTINGGEEWVEQWAYSNSEYYNIVCVDEDIAYVSGEYGFILKTTDGGGLPVNTSDINPVNQYHNVYPNPCDNYLTIEAPVDSRVCILNIEGKIINSIIMKNAPLKINIESIPDGIYLINVTSKENTYTSKFIKTSR